MFFGSSILWDGRQNVCVEPTPAPDQCPSPAQPIRIPLLVAQVSGAAQTLMLSKPPTLAQDNMAAHLMTRIFTAMVRSRKAGSLTAQVAQGGQFLANLAKRRIRTRSRPAPRWSKPQWPTAAKVIRYRIAQHQRRARPVRNRHRRRTAGVSTFSFLSCQRDSSQVRRRRPVYRRSSPSAHPRNAMSPRTRTKSQSPVAKTSSTTGRLMSPAWRRRLGQSSSDVTRPASRRVVSSARPRRPTRAARRATRRKTSPTPTPSLGAAADAERRPRAGPSAVRRWSD